MKTIKLKEKEHKKFQEVLETHGYKTDCQRSTGISRATLNRLIKEKNCSEDTYYKVKQYCA